jgi:hypothetical protein
MGENWVLSRNLSEDETLALQVPEDIESTPPMRNLLSLMANLEAEFGYLQGDVPLHSVVNTAIDVRGQDYFTDLIENPDLVTHLHTVISRTIYQVGRRVKALLDAHGAPWDKVGVCCINMDYGTPAGRGRSGYVQHRGRISRRPG